MMIKARVDISFEIEIEEGDDAINALVDQLYETIGDQYDAVNFNVDVAT